MYNKNFENKREFTKEEKLEKMIEKWKKISKENVQESEKEHTKSDGKKKKKIVSERRKMRNVKRNN